MMVLVLLGIEDGRFRSSSNVVQLLTAVSHAVATERTSAL